MPGRTIAIGDIHGCSAALLALLDCIQPQAGDTLVTLGDYIDRGPDSRGVVERLLRLNDECLYIPLLGNHEAMLLSSLINEADIAFWKQCGGQATLASYGWSDSLYEVTKEEADPMAPSPPRADEGESLARDTDVILDSHITFFQSCAFAYETESFLFLHANYVSDQPIDEQDEFVLLWKHLNRGIPAPHISGKTAIVGHTPQMNGEVLDVGHLICIDTFCFGDGWLTAMEVETKQVWQANKDGVLRC